MIKLGLIKICATVPENQCQRGLDKSCMSASRHLQGHSAPHEPLHRDRVQRASHRPNPRDHLPLGGTRLVPRGFGQRHFSHYCHYRWQRRASLSSYKLEERWTRWSEFTVHYALHENEEKK